MKDSTKYIHIMKYMGSKRELLPDITDVLETNVPEGSVVLDIFAGTCGVGINLRDKYVVYSNDIQNYSRIISQGIIELEPAKLSVHQIKNNIEPLIERNRAYLLTKFSDYLSQSQYFIDQKIWNASLLKEYKEYLQLIPSPSNSANKNMSDPGRWLISTYFKDRDTPVDGRFPFVQTTALFSEMYFSLYQAIVIDSIRYAIENLDGDLTYLKSTLLSALLYSYSYSSAGTGHFAQFRDLNSLSSVQDVFLYRTRSVEQYFYAKLSEILEGTKINKYWADSKSFAKDYRDLLADSSIMSNVDVIYADPPYSFVHYSRFYHAIEDLCLYDYPAVEHKGRYRLDRHQSPFCIKTKVHDAFKDLIYGAFQYKKPLLISYSNTGMIELEDILSIGRDIGYTIKIQKLDHKHSTMGRKGDKDRDVTEALIWCYLR